MIWLGSDHAGFELKEAIKQFLLNRNVLVADLGTESVESVDYSSFAEKVSKRIIDSPHDKGILFCASGQGMAMAANRHKRIRCAIGWNEKVAKESREDNDSNILSLPADYLTIKEAENIVWLWLETDFSHSERHLRRIHNLDK